MTKNREPVVFESLIAAVLRVAGSFGSSFQAEKAPYVITLFVAALGWTALRTADRLQQTPFVEYRTAILPSAQGVNFKFASIRLRNVTSSQTFDCFILEQITPGRFGESVDQRVRYRGNVAVNTILAKATPNNWRWEVNDFMPGADLELGAPLLGSQLSNVLVRPCEKTAPPADAKESAAKSHSRTPILIEHSHLTMYIEHELKVLWAGLFTWLLFLVFLNSRRSKAALAPEVQAASQNAPETAAALAPSGTPATPPATAP